MAVASPARQDIARQRVYDENYTSHQDMLLARLAAVVAAQRALARGEYASTFVLRQALVGLAAICELTADELPAPRV